MNSNLESCSKIIVGNVEWCALKKLGIPAIKARVDSGAKTSSLHAFNIRTFQRDNLTWVSFDAHPLQHSKRTIIQCEHPVIDKRIVKSSSGTREKRYVIKTELTINGKKWDIELTLTNRDSMGYRMLLGREAMHGKIMVDPSIRYHLGKLKKSQLEKHYGKVTTKKKA